MRAARCTFFLSTWSTRLAASFHALRMAALNIAPLSAKWARLAPMTWSRARVLAISEIAPTLLLTLSVFLFDDLWSFTRTTFGALLFASVTARHQGPAYRSATEGRVVDINMALECDFVFASGHCALHFHTARCLARILILPTWQAFDVMSARQVYGGPVDYDIAKHVTRTAALVRTVMVTTLFNSVARFCAIDCFV